MNKEELDLQIKILEAFFEDEELAYNYSYFEEKTGANRQEIKKIMDRLRKNEVVEYVKGLMTEEGELAGSGFQLSYNTLKLSAREWLAKLKQMQSEAVVANK